MKKDENVCQSWDRRGASGAQNELPAEFCGFFFSALGAAVAVIWQSRWRDDDFISLFESSCSPPSADVRIASQYILSTRAAGKVLYLVQEFLPFTSFGETDLYFPAHWPGYYYKWEGNNIGWTAGSARNLLHICPFHGGLWARDSVHLSSLQAANLFIHPSVGVSLRVFKSDVILYREYRWRLSLC